MYGEHGCAQGRQALKDSAHRCPSEGTHLERYGRLFRCAEINASFYRIHAPATYAKWRAATPAEFLFAVKIPRLITHERELKRSRNPFEQFLGETANRGMTQATSRGSLTSSGISRSRSMSGACSTIRHADRPSKTPGKCRTSSRDRRGFPSGSYCRPAA